MQFVRRIFMPQICEKVGRARAAMVADIHPDQVSAEQE